MNSYQALFLPILPSFVSIEGMITTSTPLFRINASAPTRICDNGGWTDTWFAEYGSIFNIAIAPRTHVQLTAWLHSAEREQITIHAENYGDTYAYKKLKEQWQKHPLIEATIAEMGVPDEYDITINLYSDAPPGASTGTSASVTVALIGALATLDDRPISPTEIALIAQRIETVRLGGQCGIQDQIAAAFGGINLITMTHYPHAEVTPVPLTPANKQSLQARLALFYLGTSHNSSAVHRQVITHLEDAGPTAPALVALRSTAARAAHAVTTGDWVAFGRSLDDNTALQAELHPALVSPAARQLMETAKAYGALGAKVNGAGGDGGSVTILGGDDAAERRAMCRAILALDSRFRQLPCQLSAEGLTVWRE